MTREDTYIRINMDRMKNIHPTNRTFIWLHRIGQYYYFNSGISIYHKICSYFFRIIWKLMYSKINHIPLETKIGGGLFMPHRICIVLAGGAILGENVTVLHGVTIGADITGDGGAPIIGDNVFIGAGATIIGRCSIGNNVVIGANAVVTKDVPSEATVVGFNHIIEKVAG